MSRIIDCKPSIENCEPIAIYKTSTPVNFTSETPVLYGGGRKWFLSCVHPSLSMYFPTGGVYQDVDVFVLNVSFIIWLNEFQQGIEIPYTSIAQHGMRQNEETGSYELLLKVENSGLFQNLNQSENGFVMVFKPMYAETDRYCNEQIERLFTYEYFGVNRGDKMVSNTFDALTECCTRSYMDVNNNGNNGHTMAPASGMSMNEIRYNNSGNADDIDYDFTFKDGDESAGIAYQEQLRTRGVVRQRDDGDYDSRKRLKC